MSNEQTLPIRWDLTGEDAIVQGADWRREMLLSYDDGTIWPTSGYTGRMMIRADYDTPVLLDCSTANGRIEVGIQGTAPNQRNIAITLTAATTAALTFADVALYDLALTDSTGHVVRAYFGTVALNRRVTY